MSIRRFIHRYIGVFDIEISSGTATDKTTFDMRPGTNTTLDFKGKVCVITWLSVIEDCRQLIRAALEHFGQIGVLVNNVATTGYHKPTRDLQPKRRRDEARGLEHLHIRVTPHPTV
jgi:hypothetical protein